MIDHGGDQTLNCLGSPLRRLIDCCLKLRGPSGALFAPRSESLFVSLHYDIRMNPLRPCLCLSVPSPVHAWFPVFPKYQAQSSTLCIRYCENQVNRPVAETELFCLRQTASWRSIRDIDGQ